jgi:hypothetical protein
MSLFSIVGEIDESDSFHLSRLLVLLSAFAGTSKNDEIEGITKLAKLDFLLRYPEYLERALEARHTNPRSAEVRDFERNSVESAMVRFKYGPWDFRYRKFLNLLVGKGLVHISLRGRTVYISLTAKGNEISNELSEKEEFAIIAERSRLLKTHFDLSASTLVKFVYTTFPEIANLRYGTKINQ